ncbi:type II toxin-antitoxin system RelE/ParE family toxin, partial [Sulfurospirillum sp. T05]|nr:type II toxin-antitoxin system RelE/ParE family toxin [Sulfurospirillum tamanensis]
KPVGEGVSEARVDLGPGYRLYYFIRGKTIVIVLHGGSKAHQQKDIDKAKALAKEFK